MLYIHENTIYNSTYIKDLAYLCWHQSLKDYILSKASDLSSASCSTAILIIQPTVSCVLSQTCKCNQLSSRLHRSCASSTHEEKIQWRALTFPVWGFHLYCTCVTGITTSISNYCNFVPAHISGMWTIRLLLTLMININYTQLCQRYILSFLCTWAVCDQIVPCCTAVSVGTVLVLHKCQVPFSLAESSQAEDREKWHSEIW